MCDVGLEVCFNVHTPEAFQGNSRRLQRDLLRRGGAHFVFPIYQAAGGIAKDQAWDL